MQSPFIFSPGENRAHVVKVEIEHVTTGHFHSCVESTTMANTIYSCYRSKFDCWHRKQGKAMWTPHLIYMEVHLHSISLCCSATQQIDVIFNTPLTRITLNLEHW